MFVSTQAYTKKKKNPLKMESKEETRKAAESGVGVTTQRRVMSSDFKIIRLCVPSINMIPNDCVSLMETIPRTKRQKNLTQFSVIIL